MSTFDILRKESFYDRRLREKREAEAAERCERLARDAKLRDTRQAAADNAAAWQAWFHNALLSEFRGKDSPLVGGIAEFVSVYTGEKRDELRAELRREFADQQKVLEARCAALERRLENVAQQREQGKREKFEFAHERSTVAGPSFPPGRKFVMKH